MVQLRHGQGVLSERIRLRGCGGQLYGFWCDHGGGEDGGGRGAEGEWGAEKEDCVDGYGGGLHGGRGFCIAENVYMID